MNFDTHISAKLLKLAKQGGVGLALELQN